MTMHILSPHFQSISPLKPIKYGDHVFGRWYRCTIGKPPVKKVSSVESEIIITASIQSRGLLWYTRLGEISKKLEIRLQVTEYIFQDHLLGQFYFKGSQIS